MIPFQQLDIIESPIIHGNRTRVAGRALSEDMDRTFRALSNREVSRGEYPDLTMYTLEPISDI